jgi:hypothetical protein
MLAEMAETPCSEINGSNKFSIYIFIYLFIYFNNLDTWNSWTGLIPKFAIVLDVHVSANIIFKPRLKEKCQEPEYWNHRALLEGS